MLLEARQKMTKATEARPNDESVNRCWAKTMPTNRERFFVHCRGRSAESRARALPRGLPERKLPRSGCCVSTVLFVCLSFLAMTLFNTAIPHKPGRLVNAPLQFSH